jgi:hypothetical protein
MAERTRNVEQAGRLMLGFAEQTGLRGAAPNQRYLWTDAFAVCNFIALSRSTADETYLRLALELVERVHHTLGRYRDDDARKGWISGLDESEGSRHPTRGGLRIGKPLPERSPEEPVDAELEWERDGQYFHYLTKWMHALDRLSRATREPRFNLWARELLEAARQKFQARPPGLLPRLYWKMSTDLSRPLVTSSGQHDALDGLLTAEGLQATAAELASLAGGPDLLDAVRDFSLMLERGELATTDPLGLGELLSGASLAARLPADSVGARLLPRLLGAAFQGLREYERSRPFEAPTRFRLAFRELGLGIGLSGVEVASRELAGRTDQLAMRARDALEALRPFVPMSSMIRSFWSDPERQSGNTWKEHRAIDEVMLATALVPDGYLE